jgi:hypothetical protein
LIKVKLFGTIPAIATLQMPRGQDRCFIAPSPDSASLALEVVGGLTL